MLLKSENQACIGPGVETTPGLGGVTTGGLAAAAAGVVEGGGNDGGGGIGLASWVGGGGVWAGLEFGLGGGYGYGFGFGFRFGLGLGLKLGGEYGLLVVKGVGLGLGKSDGLAELQDGSSAAHL